MSKVNSPVMRYHGAKFRLAPWVMSFFPEHGRYIEPFGGAAGVLLQKPRVVAEVYNDLDGDIVNVFRVLQDPDKSKRLIELLLVTPYAREEFERSYEHSECSVEMARRTLVRAAMGFGSAGATKGSTGFRSDSRRKYGTASHLWAKYPETVSTFCKRLEGVIIENRPAVDVIRDHDGDDALFFVDPPYVRSTRAVGGYGYGRSYRHEMTDDDHAILLETLKSVDGMVVVSGYESELYNDSLCDWQRHETSSRISAGRGTTTRMECVWLNPRCAAAQNQGSLFRRAL